MQRVAENLGRRHAGLFARLDIHAEKVFLLDPTDLPFIFRLSPRPDRPMIEPLRRGQTCRWDARISGPLAALVGMVHGAYDGDALFFSRDIVIEGDTEAVVALRNALDDAAIDLPTEIAAAFGPAAPAVERAAHRILPVMARFTGFNFVRADR